MLKKNMDTEKFERLAELRIKEREIKKEIEVLLPEINESVVDIEDGTAIQVKHGIFTVKHLRKWEYTPETKRFERELKDRKKSEEQTGEATYVTSPSVRFVIEGEENE